ncbi:hypothetical protein CC2G_011180 [Coprinopsis cinerea AmutBmut pab1-1]|nr:hypothetical protein CC2G_011180 [Coprinopsis cinerea AmutBmut pab1-1]
MSTPVVKLPRSRLGVPITATDSLLHNTKPGEMLSACSKTCLRFRRSSGTVCTAWTMAFTICLEFATVSVS